MYGIAAVVPILLDVHDDLVCWQTAEPETLSLDKRAVFCLLLVPWPSNIHQCSNSHLEV